MPALTDFQLDTYAQLGTRHADLAARFTLDRTDLAVGDALCRAYHVDVDGQAYTAALVRIRPRGVDICECGTGWPWPSLPVPTSRVVRTFGADSDPDRLLAAVADAVQARLDGFTACTVCGCKIAPEHWSGDRCGACSEGEGPVY